MIKLTTADLAKIADWQNGRGCNVFVESAKDGSKNAVIRITNVPDFSDTELREFVPDYIKILVEVDSE